LESEKLKKRISRQESLEALFKGGQGSILSCSAKEEEEVMAASFHTHSKL
jgi:hypothetical protein